MSRIWIAAVALAAAAAAGAIVLARGGGSASARPRAPLTVRVSLDREAVEFGDPVTAVVTVLVDRRALGSPDVLVHETLAPLTELGRPRLTRTTRGDLLGVTYSARGSCLDQHCVTRRGAKQVVLAPARVEVAGSRARTPPWPTLRVRGRVSGGDVTQAHPPLRTDVKPPPLTYRFEPARLARVLEVAAALLAAAAVLLAGAAAAAVARRRRHVERLTGLERALALAREAERRPVPDRRRALALLARLLRTSDARLAGAADELAWSAPAPTPAAVSELVTQVEREVNGR